MLLTWHLEGWAFHHVLNLARKRHGKKGTKSSSTTSAVTLDKLLIFPAVSLLVCEMIRSLPTASLSGSFTSLTGAGWPKMNP